MKRARPILKPQRMTNSEHLFACAELDSVTPIKIKKFRHLKKVTSIFAFLLASTALGQTTIQKSSLDSGGMITTTGSVQILSTIGEIAIQEKTVGSTHLSEGFISPDIMSSVGIQDYANLDGILIYPNPVVDLLHISSKDTTSYEYHFFDLLGKEIALNQSNELQNEINVSFLSSGVYILVVVDHQNKSAASFKIQKIEQ